MARPVTLNYGSAVRWNTSLIVRRCVLAGVALALCMWGTRLGYQRYYWYDRDSVQATLSAIPSAQFVGIGGFDEGGFLAPWQAIHATVCVAGASDKEITLSGPTARDLRNGTHIRVSQIGPYTLTQIRSDGSQCGGLDFGTDGEFAGLLPFEVRSVNDLVTHYDKTAAFLAGLPASGSHRAKDGRVHRYLITR